MMENKKNTKSNEYHFDRNYFLKYIEVFLEQNKKLNLISKNDEQFIWEKHIYDSLSIELFFEKYIYPQKLLDIGTGGGFPAVPIALVYPQIAVTGIDSIAKKIRAVQSIKEQLSIGNLTLICDRAENLTEKYELITSRAVSSMKNICSYALPLLTTNGYFVAYKSLKTEEEIKEALPILKKYNAKIVDIINYDLPTTDKLTRKLVVIRKN